MGVDITVEEEADVGIGSGEILIAIPLRSHGSSESHSVSMVTRA